MWKPLAAFTPEVKLRFEIVRDDEQLSSHSGLVLVGALLRTYAVEVIEALFDIAMKVTVNSFRNLGLGMVIVFLAYLVASVKRGLYLGESVTQ